MVAPLSPRPLALLAVFLVTLGGLTAAWAVSPSVDATEGPEAPDPPPPVANSADAVFLLRLGLGADVLTAAGVRAADMSELIGAVFTARAQAGTTLDALDLALGTARTTRDALERQVASGLATQEEVAELAQAEVDFADADAARQLFIDQLRSVALATLDSEVATVLGTMYQNRSWRSVDTEFLVDTMSEREWVELRDALAAERIAENDGEPCPQAAATLLASHRAVNAVSTAKVNLDTYLGSVQTAWNAAVE